MVRIYCGQSFYLGVTPIVVIYLSLRLIVVEKFDRELSAPSSFPSIYFSVHSSKDGSQREKAIQKITFTTGKRRVCE